MSQKTITRVLAVVAALGAGCYDGSKAEDEIKDLRSQLKTSRSNYDKCVTEKSTATQELKNIYENYSGPRLSQFDFTRQGPDDLRKIIERYLSRQTNGRVISEATNCLELGGSVYSAIDGPNDPARRAAFVKMFETSLCDKDLFTAIKTPAGTIPVAVYTKPQPAATGTSK